MKTEILMAVNKGVIYHDGKRLATSQAYALAKNAEQGLKPVVDPKVWKETTRYYAASAKIQRVEARDNRNTQKSVLADFRKAARKTTRRVK